MNKIFLLLPLLLAVPAVAACPKGFTEWEGVCSADLQPEKANPADEVKPSDEKPPRSGQTEWERGEVKVMDGILAPAPSTSTEHNYAAERDQK